MNQRYARQHLELVGGRSTTKLPKYMFRRGDTYYFKRKIPADAFDAFPEYSEQVWKSLETSLLSTAKVRRSCRKNPARFRPPWDESTAGS